MSVEIVDFRSRKVVYLEKSHMAGGALLGIRSAIDPAAIVVSAIALTPAGTRDLIDALEAYAEPNCSNESDSVTYEAWRTTPFAPAAIRAAIEELLELAGDTSIQPRHRIDAAEAVLDRLRS